jgi:thioredoxin reductase
MVAICNYSFGGELMAHTIVVGDGPGGLSAALFLAKNREDVTVFGTDETAMHYALLSNYLGIPKISGTGFQRIARSQAEAAGAVLRNDRVASVARSDAGFAASLENGETVASDYLILSEGRNPELATSLGVEASGDGIATDREGRSSVEGVYVIGRAARAKRSQAIISAGAGAVAAIDILSTERATDIQDWDSLPKD